MTRAAIVGAGFGGLAAALRLEAAGFRDVVIYERESDVGGTWLLNSYPGVACDAPSHIYSYSFAQDVDWSRRFAPGHEIQAYLQRCVAQAGIVDRIEFGAEVASATWTGADWSIELADGRCDRADVLVPAVGQLTVPAMPDLPGLDAFSGEVFHTARWRHDVELRGKRVAIIGTGASAIQVIPSIAPDVEHLTIFQRSAPYVLRKSDAEYSARLHRRYRSIPLLRRAVRQMIWANWETVTAGFTRWPGLLGLLARYHERILRAEVPDEELRAKLRPDFAIGCKRILISDDYHAALIRPNVTLVTDPVTAVGRDGITAADELHRADVVVLATGYRTSPFIPGLSILGRDGITLHDKWSDGPGAFLGMSVPDFPNMFLVYGPNTNLGSGSIVYMLESQARHIVDAVKRIAAGASVIEVTEAAYRNFRSVMTRKQSHTVWGGCRSWYHDAVGRDTHNWPWLMSTYRRRTRRIRLRDYAIHWAQPGSTGSAPPAISGRTSAHVKLPAAADPES